MVLVTLLFKTLSYMRNVWDFWEGLWEINCLSGIKCSVSNNAETDEHILPRTCDC